MRKTVSNQAITSLLYKSDLNEKQKEIIRRSIHKAVEIREDIRRIIDETPMIQQRANVGQDAIQSINDAIAYISIFSSRTDVRFCVSSTTGKYVLNKQETDVSAEIALLTK